MAPEVRTLLVRSVCLTGALVIVVGLLFVLLWPADTRWQALEGLVWGALVALLGLVMISRMAASAVSAGSRGRRTGTAGYALRYGVYAILLLAGAWMHFPVLSMLAGIAASKASLVILSVKQGKDRT